MNLGFSEMLFIFLIALIIFGPKKMPEIGRQIGKFMAEFKRASNDFKSQLETEMRQIEIEEALRKEKDALREAIYTPEGTIVNSDPVMKADTPAVAEPQTSATEPEIVPENSISEKLKAEDPYREANG